ncbi:MAG: heme-binding Shp domain-containing protein [Lachnospiraceae bacterium]
MVLRKIKHKVTSLILTLIIILVLMLVHNRQVFAMEAGTYLVTVTPSYVNPATGGVDDPGNNEAIGQGMTERLCGSTGLLEVDGNGQMYLTVRYYLSQFINKVSFEEGDGRSYTSLSYQVMQKKNPVSGTDDIADKYGYTDYRMSIGSSGSVFRGKAYVEPMGRDVVYFFTLSGGVPGSGDFITSSAAAVSDNQITNQADQTVEITVGETTAAMSGNIGESTDSTEEESEAANTLLAEDGYGSGDIDDPVTGIPVKSDGDGSEPAIQTTQTQHLDQEAYHLDSGYDLSSVPIKAAREKIEPLLDEAVGITNVDEQMKKSMAAISSSVVQYNSNHTIMVVLVTVAAVLLLQFMVSGIRQNLKNRRQES